MCLLQTSPSSTSPAVPNGIAGGFTALDLVRLVGPQGVSTVPVSTPHAPVMVATAGGPADLVRLGTDGPGLGRQLMPR